MFHEFEQYYTPGKILLNVKHIIGVQEHLSDATIVITPKEEYIVHGSYEQIKMIICSPINSIRERLDSIAESSSGQ